jgi:hypothetical protein
MEGNLKSDREILGRFRASSLFLFSSILSFRASSYDDPIMRPQTRYTASIDYKQVRTMQIAKLDKVETNRKKYMVNSEKYVKQTYFI